MILIKKKKKPNLKNPILVEGLPGIGNVAKISVDFIAKELKAEEYCTIYSDDLPHSVFVSEESLVTLPNLKVYFIKNKKRDIVLLIGDTQASSEPGTYRISEAILKVSRDLGVKEIITLGGIGHRKVPKIVKLHTVATSKKTLSKIGKRGVCTDPSCVSVVIGAAGVLLGLAQQNGFEGFSLLVDTYAHPAYLGVKGARKIVKFLSEYLGFKIDLKKMKEMTLVEEPKRRSSKRNLEKESINYIG